jgi:hypothetical protein
MGFVVAATIRLSLQAWAKQIFESDQSPKSSKGDYHGPFRAFRMSLILQSCFVQESNFNDPDIKQTYDPPAKFDLS